MKKNKLFPFSLLLITAIIWGGAYPILNYIIELNEMSYAMINLLRFALSILVLFPFVIVQFKSLKKTDIIISLICGVILFFAFLLLTHSIPNGTPGVTALLINASIFVVPILSSIANKRLIKPYVILCVILMFIGFLLLYFKDGFVLPSKKYSLSIILASCSAILFSIQVFIVGRYHKNERTSLCVSWIQNSVVAFLFLIYILIFESNYMFAISGTTFILPMCILGVLGTGFTYFFQAKASLSLSENSCNIVLSSEAFFASLFSIILGFDTLSIIFGIAFAIITGSIVLYILWDNRTYNKID